eukprot:1161604-Pelagomonas_calceolata.AAC.3
MGAEPVLPWHALHPKGGRSPPCTPPAPCTSLAPLNSVGNLHGLKLQASSAESNLGLAGWLDRAL